MDFDLTDEQRLLKDSVERFVADRYDFERRKAFLAAEGGFSRENWAAFAELGLLAVPFAEEDGGIGGGPVETMIVMEAFGRGLVVEPYLPTVILGGGILRHAASAEQKADLIPRIAGGEITLALAQIERGSRYDLHHVETRARKDGESWIIDGEKGVVLNGDTADTLIVVARTAGTTRDADGIGLFLVDAKAPGVSRRGYPTQDGLRAAEITFESARAEAALGDPGKGLPILARVVDEGIAAICAEAVGVMDRMRDLTVEYIKTRKQFGVPIGSFQVLQHRASDMVVAIEQARSMACYATMMAAEEDAAARGQAVSAAKVQIGRSGRFVGQQAIQLHGGIGMTMEYSIGHYFKRMTMIETLFGDADHHLEKVAAGESLFAA
ncbi:acyl-CoA dehydrogenase family protein [Enterovirga rhinocerotis]|uniref:Pimeloyl-CoA dehydrogenase small subunit n=1 Tax=Enterovirga rhinocerotis TaxID=1339210 RepID=A0A4V6PZM3_9HYPH|nr:acyl-CoA dehydrogenase family protein [Enterovirga rhinocerotis]TDR93159.1 pimeloyl-CoA dehydrogenase small subunit [Enterovirga rhinocerotis]